MPNSSAIAWLEYVAGREFLNRGHRILLHCLREPGVAACGLTFAAICLDYMVAPGINAVAPAFSCGLLSVLLLRRSSRSDSELSSAPSAPLHFTSWRILCFLLLHITVVACFLTLDAVNISAHKGPAQSLAATLAKYLVLFPTIVLVPLASWRDFIRLHRAEWIAAGIALLSFFPHRIFQTVWPWYSPILGRSVYELSRLFVPEVQYIAAPSPTLTGSQLDVTILFGCSGLQGIKLFQLLFGLLLIMDWRDLNRRRALAAYFGGLGFILCANAVRIALLFVAGNHRLAGAVIEFHLTGGWIFFTLVLILYLSIIYHWVLRRSVPLVGKPLNAQL